MHSLLLLKKSEVLIFHDGTNNLRVERQDISRVGWVEREGAAVNFHPNNRTCCYRI